MNSPSIWTDAQVHAYVDGELDSALAARLEADCASDPALAARIERQRRVRARLRAAFDPVLEEPVPPRLDRALSIPPDARVTPIAAARPPRAARHPGWWSALAASLFIGLLVGHLAPRPDAPPFVATAAGLVADEALETALSQQLSGEAPATASVRVALSFRTSTGTYCRAFVLGSGTDGLACRDGARWRVEVLASTAAPTGEYRQAGSAFSSVLLQAIDARRTDDVLTQEQERSLRDRRWQAGSPAR